MRFAASTTYRILVLVLAHGYVTVVFVANTAFEPFLSKYVG